jgi:hypothetical protein
MRRDGSGAWVPRRGDAVDTEEETERGSRGHARPALPGSSAPRWPNGRTVSGSRRLWRPVRGSASAERRTAISSSSSTTRPWPRRTRPASASDRPIPRRTERGGEGHADPGTEPLSRLPKAAAPARAVRGVPVGSGPGERLAPASGVVVAAHRGEYGDTCPGWGVPGHPAYDLTADHVVPGPRGRHRRPSRQPRGALVVPAMAGRPTEPPGATESHRMGRPARERMGGRVRSSWPWTPPPARVMTRTARQVS